MPVPVVIIGGGPAGTATAIALRDRGIDCLLLEENTAPANKPGETLPPNATPLLQTLGIYQLVNNGAHAPCTGNLVYWGSNTLQARAFFAEPHGDGWHLHRPLFEQQLQEVAIQKGVRCVTGYRCTAIAYQQDEWHISCTNKQGDAKTVRAKFVVDATGRSSRIARTLGIKRTSLDTLTGYFVTLPTAPAAFINTTFIEACCNGWWYAASLQDGCLVLNFMTDPGLHTLSAETLPPWLYHQLRQTQHLQEMVGNISVDDFNNATVKPAATSLLENITGPAWLAVGDAAISYDPLSSYGITAALGGGIYAAFAMADWLAGKPEALDAYAMIQQKTFDNCLAMLRQQYALERRWPQHAFWQKRI